MINFKTFIEQVARLTTVDQLESALKQYEQAGEIMNTEYKNLTYDARKMFAKHTEEVNRLTLSLIHNGYREHQVFKDFYYDWPKDSFTSLKKAGRSLDKLKKERDPVFKQVIQAASVVLEQWTKIADRLKVLKGKIVKANQKRAQQKAVAQTAMNRKMTDSSSLVKALEANINEYKKGAKTRAQTFIDDKISDLKANGWDLNKVAPLPKPTGGREAYTKAQQKRQIYNMITKSKSYTTGRGEPDIRVLNQTMVRKYVDDAVKMAEDNYRAFIQKMITKIGKPVVSAKVTGNLWTSTKLTVETIDGETQVWNTKMIINFSKYQKMFNQFPTKKVK